MVSPHSESVFEHWDVFAEGVRKEIDRGWIVGPWSHVPTIPFRVVPGAAIPKPRQPGLFRTIWNASIPGPRLNNSAANNGSDVTIPIASNSSVIQPSYLAMAWLSIERVCLAVNILNSASIQTGFTVMGRGRDFDHWFKMFEMAQTEHWKACLFFAGKFYIDHRAQMGRVASAHLGQRTSFLITAIATHRVLHEVQKRLESNSFQPKLRA